MQRLLDRDVRTVLRKHHVGVLAAGSLCYDTYPATNPVDVPQSATLDTFGAWTTIHTTTQDVLLTDLHISRLAQHYERRLYELGWGTVTKRQMAWAGNVNVTRPSFGSPLHVPNGTAVQGRVMSGYQASALVSATSLVAAVKWPIASPRFVPDPRHATSDLLMTTPGAAMVTVTSGAGAWTWGAYVESIASTGSGYLVQAISIGNNNDTTFNAHARVAIATGGAGSEVDCAILPHTDAYGIGGAIAANSMYLLPYPIAVPSGQRIAVRMRDATGSRSARVCVHGLEMPVR